MRILAWSLIVGGIVVALFGGLSACGSVMMANDRQGKAEMVIFLLVCLGGVGLAWLGFYLKR
jgi:hypothetical protein